MHCQGAVYCSVSLHSSVIHINRHARSKKITIMTYIGIFCSISQWKSQNIHIFGNDKHGGFYWNQFQCKYMTSPIRGHRAMPHPPKSALKMHQISCFHSHSASIIRNISDLSRTNFFYNYPRSWHFQNSQTFAIQIFLKSSSNEKKDHWKWVSI